MAADEHERERRLDPRFPVRLQCWIQQDSVTLLGTALNISRSGLFVRTLPGLAPGSDVSLEIGSGDDSFEARGRVVWISGAGNHSSNSPGVGVLLTEVLAGVERFQRLLELGAQGPLAD
jgi:Tfp pilus assembly protein PilZ